MSADVHCCGRRQCIYYCLVQGHFISAQPLDTTPLLQGAICNQQYCLHVWQVVECMLGFFDD